MNARLRVTILGCGASPGVPRIGNDWGACDPGEPKNRRTRCALMLERFEAGPVPTRVLVDTGPDIREQLLKADIGDIDAVVFTHAHADHVHGIDDLRAIWLNTRRRIDTYASDATFERLDAAFGYCFRAREGSFYPAILRHRRLIYGEPFSVVGAGGSMSLSPFRQVHGNIDTVGLRVGGFAYSSDISDVPPESLDQLEGLELWLVDALRYRPHPSHFSVDDALGWIARCAPDNAVLTHLHGDLDYATLTAEMPPGVDVAYDGMVRELPLLD